MIEIKLYCILWQIWRIELLIFQLNTVNFYAVLKYKKELVNICKRKEEAEKDLFVQKTVSSSLVAEAACRTVGIVLEDRSNSWAQAEEGRESQHPQRGSHCDGIASCEDNSDS